MLFPPQLTQLWRGELPLREAFWRYLITYDLLLNLGATLAALTVVLAQGPIVFAAIFHLLPLPYSILAAIGAWRSAERFEGSQTLASLAKIVIIVWVGFGLVF